MWEANSQAVRAQMPNCYRNEFRSWLRRLQMERPDATEQQVLETAYRRIMGERDNWRRMLLIARGERYANAQFSTFDTHGDQKKQDAVDRLKAYVGELPERLTDGGGLILFGPKGTGKDHLAMAVAQNAIMRHGIDVEWINGMDLFGQFRDAMKDDSGTNEQEIIATYTRHQALYISDPVPPSGTLTEFQTSALFRILDARYSRNRPTWVTVNVTGAQELDARIGAQNGDRLRDGALAIFCNWSSYRKTMQ